MHKLSSVLYIIGFITLPFIQAPEILLYLVGPYNKDLCFTHLVFKNTVKTFIIIGLDANILARFFLTVVLKNPARVKDGFWC